MRNDAMDSALEKLSETVRDAGRSKRALRLCGGGTKDFYGQALEGEVLDTRGHNGIVTYEPSELVITARCGAKLSEIEATMRERVLGVKIMDGRGETLGFGGQVMKNVAGYDVSRLMAGSPGTLAIVLEVSLKALPLPVAEATLRLELPEGKAIDTLNKCGGKPLPVS